MICAIHQPNFVPYLGFFNKFKKSDIFVLYDHVQYTKNDFHNRNRLKVNGSAHWLTIPVSVKLGQKINEVEFVDKSFINRHLQLIKQNYSKTKYFSEIFSDIENIYNNTISDNLVDFNISLLKLIFNKFDSSKKVYLSSDLNIDFNKKSTEALVDVCRCVKADKYLSGGGAKDYLEESFFINNKIELMWQDFNHPEYEQMGDNFLPNLSVLDSLFNLGYEDTYKII